MVTSILLALTITAATLTPTKKAEAGAILIATMNPIGIMLGSLAAGSGIIMLFDSLYCDPYGQFNCAKPNLGLGLILLDADKPSQNQFKTIPSYLLDEVYSQAKAKLEAVKENEKGIKVVTFTDEEVSELFTLADEQTLQSELDQLRYLLQAPAEL